MTRTVLEYRSPRQPDMPQRVRQVPVADVTHFHAQDKYVTAYYPGGELLLSDTLVSLQIEFGDAFVRVHRATLVARARLLEFQLNTYTGKGTVTVAGAGQPITVSRRFWSATRELLRGEA